LTAESANVPLSQLSNVIASIESAIDSANAIVPFKVGALCHYAPVPFIGISSFPPPPQF
jgi:hypothetical protein